MSIYVSGDNTTNGLTLSNVFPSNWTTDATFIAWVSGTPTIGVYSGINFFDLIRLEGDVTNKTLGLALSGLSPADGWRSTGRWRNGSGNNTYLNMPNDAKDTWSMIVGKFDLTNTRTYLEIYDTAGTLVGSGDVDHAVALATPLNNLVFFAGQHSFASEFIYAAGLALFDYQLSQADLADIAVNNNIATDHTTGLQGYWPAFTDWSLNSGVINDESSNANHITVPAAWTSTI